MHFLCKLKPGDCKGCKGCKGWPCCGACAWYVEMLGRRHGMCTFAHGVQIEQRGRLRRRSRCSPVCKQFYPVCNFGLDPEKGRARKS